MLRKPHACAIRNGYIDSEQLRVMAHKLQKTGYGTYLEELLESSSTRKAETI